MLKYIKAACEYECALKFLEKALECNRKYFGSKSMKTALSYHLLARLQSCRGDFRTALMNERETYQIYKSLLGEDHDRTRESAQVLKHLTEQAVLLQKRVNEMYKVDKTGGASSAGADSKSMVFPPIQIQQPSLQTVLAMLNIINGIVPFYTFLMFLFVKWTKIRLGEAMFDSIFKLYVI